MKGPEMTRTAFRLAHWFADRGRLFWGLQVGGWASYFVLYFTLSLEMGRADWTFSKFGPPAATMAVVAALLGFGLSSLMRYPFRRLRRMPIGEALLFAVPFLVAGSLAFGFAEFRASVIVWNYDHTNWLKFIYMVPTKLYLLGAWTALYFSITYYLEMRREMERAIRADAAAQQAQLKMLRYQLNPHFLFNALNAVSALILENDNRRADKLVARLSAFLRHSLMTEARERVTVDQEIAANLLYLEIEKERFADRLHFTTEIEEEARRALVPSLVLQPLIENAVKYAVAPREEGGSIRVRALARRDRLILRVEDDGPGLPAKVAARPESTASCGLGLANTAERLRHVYGDAHAFHARTGVNGGAEIEIDIPLEQAPREAVVSLLRRAA